MSKKRIVRLFFCTALLTLLFSVHAFAMGTDLKQTNTACNMRTGPGTSYDIIDHIPAGTRVFINETEGSWSNVEYNDKLGWVYSPCLGAKPVPSDPAAADTTYEAAVGSRVNLRAEPTVSSRIYAVLAAGSKVDVIGVSNGWAHVYYMNYEGYCAQGHLTGLTSGPDGSRN